MEQEIFYYRDERNEIRELKFVDVIIHVDNTIQDTDNGYFLVEYIKAKIAGIGELEWSQYGTKTLKPYNIYDTIEKAIRGRNCTKVGCKNVEDLFKVRYGISPYYCCKSFCLDFDIPSNIVRCCGKNSFGQDCFKYSTWVWNGVEAILINAIGICRYKSIPNSYKCPLYNLITHEFIYNTNIKGYATREACVNDNSVQVHRF